MKVTPVILGIFLALSAIGCQNSEEFHAGRIAEKREGNKIQTYTGIVAGITKYYDGACYVLVINQINQKYIGYSGNVYINENNCKKIRPEDRVLATEIYQDGKQILGKLEKIK